MKTPELKSCVPAVPVILGDVHVPRLEAVLGGKKATAPH
jgi:hypothetical protein